MIDQKSISEDVVSDGSYFLKIPLVITSLNHNNEKNFSVATAVGMQFFLKMKITEEYFQLSMSSKGQVILYEKYVQVTLLMLFAMIF